MLGILYEEGRGVPVDLDRAETLYDAAASDTRKTMLVYIPKSGKVPAHHQPVPTGDKVEGLREAKERLRHLRQRSR